MSVTITGCLEPDGSITFTEGACEYTGGCLVRGGLHDGQIKITVGESCCSSDTYYGCLDPVTKKFTITIPERCCEALRDCIIGFAGTCDDNGIIPSKLTLKISRADRNCDLQFPTGSCQELDNGVGDLAGDHELINLGCSDREDFLGVGDACQWFGRLTSKNEWRAKFLLNDCSGSPTGSCAGDDLPCAPDFPNTVLDRAVFARLSGSGMLGYWTLQVNSWVELPVPGWHPCSTLYSHRVSWFDLYSTYEQTVFEYFATPRASNNPPSAGGSAKLTVPDDSIDLSGFELGDEPC